MKLLHISDIHGDQVALSIVRNFASKRHDLEIIVASGDFLGPMLKKRRSKKNASGV